MKSLRLLSYIGAASVLGVALVSHSVAAKTVEEFYKGKDITLYVGYSPGGGYDTYSRTIARHLGRHIPGNPGFVVKNRPGAGSLKLANELFNTLPKDGSVIGIIGRGIPMEPLLGNKKAKFDPRKGNWLGSANNEVSVCVAWHKTPIKKFEDLFTRGMIVGGTGPGADTDSFPKVLNNILGTKLKLITGYPGGNEILLAMERGEVEGRCGYSWSSAKSRKGAWLREKKMIVLLQMSMQKHPEMPDVPLVIDYAKTENDRKAMELIYARQIMGRPFLIPPGVPADRVKALRTAFDATMKDPAFQADAKKQKLELAPISGAEVNKILDKLYASSPAVVALAKEAVSSVKKTKITVKKVPIITVNSTLDDIKKGGRKLFFTVDHTTKVSGSRTKVLLNGKEDARGNLKVGMKCDITYKGNGAEAKKVSCSSNGSSPEKMNITLKFIKKGGRLLGFRVKHTTKVSGSRTAVTLNGKKAKRKVLKVGMACAIKYKGNGTEAKNVDCKG